ARPRRRPRDRGDERGEALFDRGGAARGYAGGAAPRRFGLQRRAPARAALPGRDRADDLRGLERDPARDPRAGPARSRRGGGRTMNGNGSPYWNPKTETMPREDLRRLQAKKLRAVVERAYAKSAFHRRMLDAAKVKPERIRTLDDLRRIPFTTREAWMD